ncbi:hypothetical protein RDI58_026891 [Solanum bulbocastanum]|uniref:Uncharacterized protein n=1 Tax=Solanum bulbocastanum TaxID=147425 RepID=A0AAN8SWQ9_SOLBU
MGANLLFICFIYLRTGYNEHIGWDYRHCFGGAPYSSIAYVDEISWPSIGAPEKSVELPVFPLLMGRKLVAGSCIGGMKETEEMLDFVAKHNITPDIKVVPMDYVNIALERLLKSDMK